MYYCENDFIYETHRNYAENRNSEFDIRLQSQWNSAVEKGYFRYRLNIKHSKILPGKYSFLAQLSTDRHVNRRVPEEITCISQPFDATKFNFTKVKNEEYLFEIKNKSAADFVGHFIIINVSPLEYGHTLLLPALFSCLPQVATLESVQLILEVLLLSGSPALRVGFNGLCAYASVNHLHYHLYYLQHCMLLEHVKVDHLSGPCYQLLDYPAPGFVFQLPENQSVVDLARSVHCLTNYLQNSNIPHNLYVTRGSRLDVPDTGEVYNTVRVYVWARKSAAARGLHAFNPALCELFGHLIIKTESEYWALTEEKVAAVLSDICQEPFASIQDKVRQLFEHRPT